MILQKKKKINRKVQSDCTLAFMRYIGFSHTHLGIFFYFGKIFFLYKKTKKQKKKNKCAFSQ